MEIGVSYVAMFEAQLFGSPSVEECDTRFANAFMFEIR